MLQNVEQARSRLENISTIEPLLGALRTISMGTWQLALRRIDQIKEYEQHYSHILAQILRLIQKPNFRITTNNHKTPRVAKSIFLLIGSERGLCGKFNENLMEKSLDWINHSEISLYQIWAMGSKLIHILGQKDIEISWHQTLPTSSLISYQQAFLTAQRWIEQYNAYAFDQFFVLFNELVTGNQVQFTTYRLLPFGFDPLQIVNMEADEKWPPPIIETDPKGIYHQIIQNFIASTYYQIVLKSAAAEHAARFNLMQEAKDNADELLQELRSVINTERKRKITQQMQELAVGAGLLDNK
jgi:F-type H+-transporting ATPase subunit gamma